MALQKGAIRFRLLKIRPSRLVNGRTISILIRMVAGAHIGAVKRSASPPPRAAAARAYGLGRSTAAR